jgi:DNA-binding response OmpR family regulator
MRGCETPRESCAVSITGGGEMTEIVSPVLVSMQKMQSNAVFPFQEVWHMPKKQILLGGDPNSLSMPMNFFSNTNKFSVAAVHDGHEALRVLAEMKPDLAILDINLAKRGGDECCKDVKEGGLSPATPMVLMVCPQHRRDIGRCLNARCDALLVKPLVYEQMAGVITRLLFKERYTPSRFDVHFPIHYGVQPQKLVRDYSVDLSTRGLFLETKQVVPVGTLLNVEFTLPDDGTTIICTARVTWLNGPVLRREPLLPSGMGLEFLDIDNQGVNSIRRFLYSEERQHQAWLSYDIRSRLFCGQNQEKEVI